MRFFEVSKHNIYQVPMKLQIHFSICLLHFKLMMLFVVAVFVCFCFLFFRISITSVTLPYILKLVNGVIIVSEEETISAMKMVNKKIIFI